MVSPRNSLCPQRCTMTLAPWWKVRTKGLVSRSHYCFQLLLFCLISVFAFSPFFFHYSFFFIFCIVVGCGVKLKELKAVEKSKNALSDKLFKLQENGYVCLHLVRCFFSPLSASLPFLSLPLLTLRSSTLSPSLLPPLFLSPPPSLRSLAYCPQCDCAWTCFGCRSWYRITTASVRNYRVYRYYYHHIFGSLLSCVSFFSCLAVKIGFSIPHCFSCRLDGVPNEGLGGGAEDEREKYFAQV